jgi:hypothetical protein
MRRSIQWIGKDDPFGTGIDPSGGIEVPFLALDARAPVHVVNFPAFCRVGDYQSRVRPTSRGTSCGNGHALRAGRQAVIL